MEPKVPDDIYKTHLENNSESISFHRAVEVYSFFFKWCQFVMNISLCIIYSPPKFFFFKTCLSSHFHSQVAVLATVLSNECSSCVCVRWPSDVECLVSMAGFGGSGSQVDSARMNLASSFVNGFVNAAFGQDKLLTDDGNKWLYKNKDHGTN